MYRTLIIAFATLLFAGLVHADKAKDMGKYKPIKDPPAYIEQ